MPAEPSVAVVVAVFNAVETVGACLDSITAQDGVVIELIVMDGGSSDGTVAVVAEHADRISHFASESDRGVYHAWNKALRHVTSEWVCFLGADDVLAKPTNLRTLVDAGAPDADLVFARVMLVDDAGREVAEQGEPFSRDRLLRAQHVAHVGALHRRGLFDEYGGFDESYRIAGDYEFLLRLRDVETRFVDEPIVRMGGSGLSKTRLFEVLRETRAAQLAQPEISRLQADTRFLVALLKYAPRALRRRVMLR